MGKYVVKEIVALRELTFRYDNGNEVKTTVTIGVPFYVEDKDYYQCPYRINVGDLDRTFAVCGMDSMQALSLAFKALDAELEFHAKDNNGEFLFYGEDFHTLLDPEWKKS